MAEVDASEPVRLPRGRHGLTREEVAAAQRSRILRATADAMAEQGYVATSIADILRRAGVSRQTFYEQFSSKEDCFAVAYEMATDVLFDAADLTALATSAAPPLERFDRGIAAYLDALADEPAFARLFMLEVYAAGPLVLERRAEIQHRFTRLIAEAFGARDEADCFACDMLVAGISALVTARLAARDLDGLRALREPLTQLVRRAVSER